VDEYDRMIAAINEKEREDIKQRDALLISKIEYEAFRSNSYKPLIEDLNDRIEQYEKLIQNQREARIEVKKNLIHCNNFTDEGIYYCIVQNYRGGTMKIIRESIHAVIFVEKSIPYLVEVAPIYIPRVRTIRKKWNIYSSIQGTFTKGILEGLVVIRYNDGSFYEGPYIPETAIDHRGKAIDEAKARNHYGVYTLSDGRIFEGYTVDNHFDVRNLNSFYRLTLPNKKGIYEGYFCDEQFHGSGMFTYEDGSVYEGHWFRGTRFGHGQYRSSEGWTYEGFYDTDRRHRLGIINYPNGSCYMGEWFYDDIKGKGIYITPLRDVYRGELLNKLFHGVGELLYADGSKYIGDFKDGIRCGKGIFTDSVGHEYYGNFINDVKHGEHVVKLIISTEEVGQDNYEIRIGQYENGNLIKWKLKFSNPIATKQFIKLFKKNRDMFDSVYSMILAKNLPALPDGIDANNDQVKNIIYKIRQEAGMLVGEHALKQAMAQLDALLKPINEKKKLIENYNAEIEKLCFQKATLDYEANRYNTTYNNFMSKYDKLSQQNEQYWIDDPTEIRYKFNLACKALDTLSVDDYFRFHNHRVIPPFVQKIFDGICCLLNLDLDWNVQTMLVSDALTNSRNGDEEAVRLNYKCKLAELMKTYKVYDYVNIQRSDVLDIILADIRFHRDSYYVQSTGPCGPILVDWVKINFQYIKAARKIYKQLRTAEEFKMNGYRAKANRNKRKDEVQEIEKKIEIKRGIATIEQIDLEELQHGLLKAHDLLEFIAARFTFSGSEARMDYYKLFEQKIEAKRDVFTIEVTLQGIIDQVIIRSEKEKYDQKNAILASGQKWIEPEVIKPLIRDWILEEVITQQNIQIEKGQTIGYWFEPEDTDLKTEYTAQLISLIIDIVTAKMNDTLNDKAEARSWISRKGKFLSSRFLFIEAWRCWEQKAIEIRDNRAVENWEQIFGDTDSCARMAMEAKLSVRMSSIARDQAKIWAKCHPDEIKAAEIAMSNEFESMYENGEDIAVEALAVIESDSDEISPTIKACCSCWIRLHPDEMNKARDAKNKYLADLFHDQYPDNTGETCFKILNGWGNSEEMQWVEYADHWKSFHMEEYDKCSIAILKEMANEFIEKYPVNTYISAAEIIEKNAVVSYITDEEIKAQYIVDEKDLLNANTWGTLNQGMLRKGRNNLQKEFLGEVKNQWNDLELQTENFTKGSSLMINSNDIEDRFLGFRNRLLNKFAWLYGYLCLQYDVTLKAIENHILMDPIEKTIHRVRPSLREKYIKDKDREYLQEKNRLEKLSVSYLEKISLWNTYFGIVNKSEELQELYYNT
jgi:hypothetical protein